MIDTLIGELQKVDVNEITYRDFRQRQSNITQLWPEFHSRVRAVADFQKDLSRPNSSGVQLIDMKPELWHFKITSGTKQGVKYDNYVKFLNIPEMIKKLVKDKNLWVKDGSRVDLTKLANAMMPNLDIQTFCSCPADLYWGFQYIRTKADAKYTEPETRKPKKNNVGLKGIACKHGQLLLECLMVLTSTFSTYLRTYYSKEITDAEGGAATGEPLPNPAKPTSPAAKEEPKKEAPKSTVVQGGPKQTSTKVEPAPKSRQKYEIPMVKTYKPATKQVNTPKGAATKSANKQTTSTALNKFKNKKPTRMA